MAVAVAVAVAVAGSGFRGPVPVPVPVPVLFRVDRYLAVRASTDCEYSKLPLLLLQLLLRMGASQGR